MSRNALQVSLLATIVAVALPASAAPPKLAIQGHIATVAGGPVPDGK